MSRRTYGNRASSPINRQQGFLVPLAIFIVVVMSFFAVALWRTTMQTSLSGAQELMSVQAFYAAESGAQEAMQVLFYPDASSRVAVNDRCNSLNLSTSFNGVVGLNGCRVQVTCDCANCGASDVSSYYTIISEGSCGSGLMRASRTIRVGSFMDQE